ncbi:MAG TPA: NAD(P)H-binding protein [Jiangellaceae bacterium]|nr:NAD(P)H-binding protein [Jiangellaceae bacterium]
MKLTVFGATGRIGGHVVRQALDAGYEVTAVVRDPAKFAVCHPALMVATVADLTDTAKVQPTLDGSDAAISGIGPRTRSDVTVASRTAHGILRALEANGPRRFVAVTAAPVGPIPNGETWLYRRILLPMVTALLRDVYTDLAVMEDEIERSATDWTIVRPPRLVNKPLAATYRTAIGGNVPRAGSISRADVAHAMLAVLDDPATIRQAVGLGGHLGPGHVCNNVDLGAVATVRP